MGDAADGFSHCGKVPGKENRFIIAGFNGAGMLHIFLGVKGVAKMAWEKVSFERAGFQGSLSRPRKVTC
jgi:hypothetical protein